MSSYHGIPVPDGSYNLFVFKKTTVNYLQTTIVLNSKIYLAAIFSAILFISCNSVQSQSGSINFEAESYTSLFNGENLDGWRIPEGDGGHWKVVDGVIDYDALSQAEGDKYLWTVKDDFQDYKLYVEWRFTNTHLYESMPFILPNGEYARDSDGKIFRWPRQNADSGILMRGGPQVQIWNWDIGSGELWGTRTNTNVSAEEKAKATPVRRADNPPGEWNAFDITVKGDRITVYLNNILVIEDGWLRGIADQGPIGLQHHGGMREDGTMDPTSSEVQFRNIWIKEI